LLGAITSTNARDLSASVRAESTQNVNRRLHGDFLPEDLDVFLAVDKPSS
jgi:hypothetical protein